MFLGKGQPLKGITADQERLIQQMINEVRQLRINNPRAGGERQFTEGEDHQAPEVYIAKVPDDGIPAMEVPYSGAPQVGAVECDIYSVQNTATGLEILPCGGGPQLVFNISKAEITTSSPYVLIVKDKSGGWIAVTTSTDSGIVFALIEDMDDMGTGSDGLDYRAEANVIYWWGRDPLGSGTADTVTVYDYPGLFKRALTGAQGIAIWDHKQEQYRVVECQTKAGWISATIYGDESGTAGITVSAINDYGGTQQDVQEPDFDTLEIDDPQDKIPSSSDETECDSGTGSNEVGTVTYSVFALLDAEDDVYHIVSVKRNTSSPTLRKIEGIEFDELPEDENPPYVLAINASGCLVRLPTGPC